MTGKELKTKITSLGRTVTEVSSLLEMTPQALNTIFNVSDVKSGTIEKLCRVLNVSITYFYPEYATDTTNTNMNNIRKQSAHNLHQGSGDIVENAAPSSDPLVIAQQALQQNADLIALLKAEKGL